MTETAQINAVASPRRSIAAGWNPFAALGCVALAFGVALRLSQRENLPLWLDEAFTGGIAGEPSLAAVLRQVFLDVNAPGYYVVAHLWASLTSFSNESLRAPALAFGLAGPLLCLAGAPGLTGRARWIWLALVALWLPAVTYSNEARGYSLLYALAIANTLAFAGLLGRRTPASALLWSASVSALLLTHYIALFIVAAQGLIALAVFGRRILGLWPAALPVAPALAFMAAHAARVREFAHPDVAWYPLIDLSVFPRIAVWTLGGKGSWFALIGLCVLLAAGRLFHVREADGQARSGYGPWLAALAGATGWLAFLVVCMFRPNFTARYIITFAPALLLGLALVGERAAAVRRYAPVALVALAFVQALDYFKTPRALHNRFEFQSGSQFLMDAGARRVAFLWDNPNNQAEAPEQMDLVGGFFFKRAGSPALVKSIRLPREADPNLALSAAAAEPGDGFIWVYDVQVGSTAAIRFPPRLDGALDGTLANFQCHTAGDGLATVLACIRRKPS